MEKRTIKLIAIIVACVLVIGGGIGLWWWLSPKRHEQLKIYNWADYMDESIIKEFETWYKESTGKKVKVIHDDDAPSAEQMMSRVEMNFDYDLIVPSDYIVGNMIDKGLLKELDKTKIPNWTNLDTDLMDSIGNYADYVMPYMVSTNGIMYDATKTAVDDQSWSAIFEENEDYRTMKKVPRDSLTAALLYYHRDALKNATGTAYTELLDSIINFTITDAVKNAKATLQAQRNAGVVEYESDTGKESMMTGEGDVRIGLYWGCDAGVAMWENTNIEYFVPEEGSNLYYDCFAMPKTAKNTDAAHAFIDFLLRPDIAVRNMEAAGADCPVPEAELEMIAIMMDEEDKESDYFILFDKDKNGAIEGDEIRWRQMFVDCVITPQSVKDRCLIMKPLSSDKMKELEDAAKTIFF